MLIDFAKPHWLWLLISLPVLILLRAWAHNRRQSRLQEMVSSRLLKRLGIGTAPFITWIRFSLYAIGITLLIISLARPLYGYRETASMGFGRNIVFAIDTSKSMLAQDLKPDRLTMAKVVTEALLEDFKQDRVGIICFAGSSFLQVPLTPDHQAIVDTMDQIDTDLIPLGGTDLGGALRLAAQTFDDAESDNNAMILLSDGEDLDGSVIEALESVVEQNVTIIAVGVGTAGGGFIPDPASPGNLVKDKEGNIVRTRLEDATLRTIAERTGGAYANLTSTLSVKQIAMQTLKHLERSALEQQVRRTPIERYRWPLALGLFSILCGLCIRPVGIIAIAALWLPISDAPSQELLDTDPMTSQAAIDKIDAILKKPQKPDVTARLHFGKGGAAYEMSDFDLALESFGQSLLSPETSLQEHAHYNLGNTLYRRGRGFLKPDTLDPERTREEWQNSIIHYTNALEINPDNENAAYNRQLVINELEALDQALQEIVRQQQRQSGGEGEPEPGETGEGGGESRQPNEQGDPKAEGDEGESDPGRLDEGEEGFGDDGEDLEGELKAAESQTEEGMGSREEDPNLTNPQTGFSPAQARRLLESMSDEDLRVRMLREPSVNSPDKDW